MKRRSGSASLRITLSVIVILAATVIAVYALIRNSSARVARQFDHYESLYAQKEYGILVDELPRFIEKHPNFEQTPKASFYLAVSIQEGGDYASALEAWQQALTLNTDRDILHRVYYGKGICHEKLNQTDEALDSFAKCYETIPDGPFSAKALYNMGVIYLKKGKTAKAVESFRALVDGFPDDRLAQDAAATLGDLNLQYLLRTTSVQHVVKRGESLDLIARKLNSTPKMIMKASNLRSTVVRANQTVNVPQPEFSIDIDLSDKLLYLKHKGKIVKSYSVGIGAPETPTPTGTFKIKNKLIDPPWYSPEGYVPAGDPKNELGTRWMGIVNEQYPTGYGIHGTIEPESIGKAESKGCIRMNNSDVEELFDLVSIGTTVRILEKLEDKSWFSPRVDSNVASGKAD